MKEVEFRENDNLILGLWIFLPMQSHPPCLLAIIAGREDQKRKRNSDSVLCQGSLFGTFLIFLLLYIHQNHSKVNSIITAIAQVRISRYRIFWSKSRGANVVELAFEIRRHHITVMEMQKERGSAAKGHLHVSTEM